MTGIAVAQALPILLGLAVGALLGLSHFATLWWNTRLYAEGGAVRALLVQIVRFAVLIAVLAGLARLGAAALVSGAIGLLVVRHLVVRRIGGLPWVRR